MADPIADKALVTMALVGLPLLLVVIAGPVEATAIGNILVQAMATGDVKSLAEARSIEPAGWPPRVRR